MHYQAEKRRQIGVGYELIVNFSRGKRRKKRKTGKEPSKMRGRIINLVVEAEGDTKP